MFKKLSIILLGFLSFQALSDNDQSKVTLDRLDKLAETVDAEPDTALVDGWQAVELNEKGKKLVTGINTIRQGEGFKSQVDKWKDTFENQLNLDDWKEAGNQDEPQRTVAFSERPVLFISSSMPISTLRNYARDMEKIQGVMVLRGGVGGLKKIKPTYGFIKQVLKKKPTCKTEPCELYSTEVIIDPILFSEYGINRVPAFTVHGREQFTAYCNQKSPLNKNAAVSYGDSNIKYHLEQIQQGEEYKHLIESL